MFETALRTALQRDEFPPWIVSYTIRCAYAGSANVLQSEVDRLFGSQPSAGARLFALAVDNAKINTTSLAAALPGADPVLLARYGE